MPGVRKPDHCDCIRCLRERDERIGWLPVESCRMIVCSECGNKRCPHASDHRKACTGSNEPEPLDEGPGVTHEGVQVQCSVVSISPGMLVLCACAWLLYMLWM